MTDETPTYSEDRCALRTPFVLLGVTMPILFLLCVVAAAVTGSDSFVVLAVVPLFVWIFTNGGKLALYWPVGIRIDSAGVRIGNVRRSRRSNRRKPPMPGNQSYQIFSVAWADTQSMEVVTDRKRLRDLRKSTRRAPTPSGARTRGGAVTGRYLGVMLAPFTRAALVLEVDPERAHYPEFRVQRPLPLTTAQVGVRSGTWVVPTRRPDQLSETIGRITSSHVWNTRGLGMPW